METNFTDLGEHIEEAFVVWREQYIRTHPIREKPKNASLGWMFWFMMLILVSQILLAALRTSDIFYVAAYESSGNTILAFSEAGLAIMAIEVGMVFYAVQDTIRKHVTEEIKGSVPVMFVMLGISIGAGLLQSISIVENINPQFLLYLQYAVSISIGVGASFVAYIGGKYLGAQIVLRQNEQNQLDEEYQLYLDEYNAAMVRSWNASKERKIARQGLVISEQRAPVSETFGNFQKVSVDWRNLSRQEQEMVAEMSRVDVMHEFGVSERTAYNWKQYAEELFGSNGR